MPYTVRLCRDLSGWFATLGDDMSDYPGVSVQWETAFESPDRAMSVLDLAQALALRLVGEAFVSWRPEPVGSRSTWHNRPFDSPVVGGMAWASYHYEGGRVLAVVQVSHDQNGYGLRLKDSRRHSEAAIYYPSRQAAFDVADALVRVRHRAHECGMACSGWTESASAEELGTSG
jgi:hypothetical protein